MNGIPDYQDIYEFPGGYSNSCNPHSPRPEPGFQPSYAKETSKSIDIYDKFGNLRYNVQLSSRLMSTGSGREYKTTVSMITALSGCTPFLQIPPGEDFDPEYGQAIATFDGCVSKYQSLVNAEMADFRDIDVYREKIHYEVQDPECCNNCKYCMKTFAHDKCNHHKHDKAIKLQCCCPLNEQVFNYAKQFPQFPSGCDIVHSWQKLPWQNGKCEKNPFGDDWDPMKFPNIIFPVVQPLGKCENYLSGESEYNVFCPPPPPPGIGIERSIAPPFDPTKEYAPNDLVYYQGKLYKCIEANAGNWDPSHFQLTNLDEVLRDTYVPNDIAHDVNIDMESDPTQRNIANALKALLILLGKEASNGS